MIFFGILFAIILMGVMASMALNKKSNFAVRLASLIALGVMILTVLICLFIILTDDTVPVDPSVLIVGAPPPEPPENNYSTLIMILLFFILVGLFGVIAYMSMKEHRKLAQK